MTVIVAPLPAVMWAVARIDVWQPNESPGRARRYQAVCDACTWGGLSHAAAGGAAAELREHLSEPGCLLGGAR